MANAIETAKYTAAFNGEEMSDNWYRKNVLVSVKPVTQPTDAKEIFITLFSTLSNSPENNISR
jgi:hypothetical protein